MSDEIRDQFEAWAREQGRNSGFDFAWSSWQFAYSAGLEAAARPLEEIERRIKEMGFRYDNDLGRETWIACTVSAHGELEKLHKFVRQSIRALKRDS